MKFSFLQHAAVIAALMAPAPSLAFEPPVFPLNEAQIAALGAYAKEKGEKAFAAGAAGQFSVQSGFASAAVAANEALKACDKDVDDATKRCILIDLNGTAVPLALQLAQVSRADPAAIERPVPLRDFTLDADAWAAMEGYAAKAEHKAFAISLKGPWARSWEAATVEEAEKQALEACNKNERAAGAPCFVLSRDGERIDPHGLAANPDLSVAKQP